MPKYIYQIIETENNGNTVGLYETKEAAIKDAKLFLPKSIGKKVQVNAVELNKMTFCSETVHAVWTN